MDNNRPGPSRQWSEEAVKGSWQSSQCPSSSSPSPRNQNPAWMRIDTQSETSNNQHSRQSMVNQWLGQQNTHHPSTNVDAVSELTTPTTSTISPAISDAATFPSRVSDLYATYPLQNANLTPPSKTSRWQQHMRETSASSSPQDRSYRFSDKSTDNTGIDNELLGVGTFADTDHSRSKLKYKPMNNWFDMWLPPKDH